MALLEQRMAQKRHAVIVVAEGAGQHLMQRSQERDPSGNVRYADIGVFLKTKIVEHFRAKDLPITVKYIDPSYTIRSCPANAEDSTFCLMLGQMAVHAAMAGKTDMFVGFWNNHFTHVPFRYAINRRKMIDPQDDVWQVFLSMNELNRNMQQELG
jgi:6-phosphofructokinase 1